jgi:leucyl aminopeptidase (aminopeptidase T)
VKRGENLLITVDSAGDFQVAEEVAKAAESLGAKVCLAWHSTPGGFGKVADNGLPSAVKGAIRDTDVWVELNDQWLMFSTPWEWAMGNGRTRYLFMGGLRTDQVVRCLSRLDVPLQRGFQDALVKRIRGAKTMRFTTPRGTDVTFRNDPYRPVANEVSADTPGPHYLIGQIGWAPEESSINGKVVLDCSFYGGGEADLGLLKEPVELVIDKGNITEVRGGEEAGFITEWLRSFGDSGMYTVAHVSFGFLPHAKPSGVCTEDERTWGINMWGFGYQGPMYSGGEPRVAATHADGIGLDTSVWMDGEMIMREGVMVDPELAEMERRLR